MTFLTGRGRRFFVGNTLFRVDLLDSFMTLQAVYALRAMHGSGEPLRIQEHAPPARDMQSVRNGSVSNLPGQCARVWGSWARAGNRRSRTVLLPRPRFSCDSRAGEDSRNLRGVMNLRQLLYAIPHSHSARKKHRTDIRFPGGDTILFILSRFQFFPY